VLAANGPGGSGYIVTSTPSRLADRTDTPFDQVSFLATIMPNSPMPLRRLWRSPAHLYAQPDAAYYTTRLRQAFCPRGAGHRDGHKSSASRQGETRSRAQQIGLLMTRIVWHGASVQSVVNINVKARQAPLRQFPLSKLRAVHTD